MAMIYLVVDTCVLADIIRQYNPLRPHSALSEKVFLKKNMLRKVNSVICDEDGNNGYIVTSTFAFLELINKFDMIFKEEIKNKTISLARIVATVQQHPSWLLVDDMDLETAKKSSFNRFFFVSSPLSQTQLGFSNELLAPANQDSHAS